MVFLNYKELPWFWHGFDHFWFAPSWSCWCRACSPSRFGWFAFRSRVTGVYLSIITQAMTFALMLAFFRNDMGFGGNNGLTDFKDILGFRSRRADARGALRASAFALALGLSSAAAIVSSRFGKVLTAVRDAESRTRFLGYRPRTLQALRLRPVGHHGGDCGRALRAAGRHHQSRRVRTRQFHRGRHLGGRRRPRHADRPDHRRRPRQLRQDLAHRRAAGSLAVRPGRALHRRHAVAAQGHRRACGAR
jgi:hypothetical protein